MAKSTFLCTANLSHNKNILSLQFARFKPFLQGLPNSCFILVHEGRVDMSVAHFQRNINRNADFFRR